MTMAGSLIDAAEGRFDRLIADRATIQTPFALRSARLAPRCRSPYSLQMTAHALRSRRLSHAQPGRAPLVQAQGLATRRHALRQNCRQIPLRRSHRRSPYLLVQLSSEPSGTTWRRPASRSPMATWMPTASFRLAKPPRSAPVVPDVAGDDDRPTRSRRRVHLQELFLRTLDWPGLISATNIK